MSPIIVCTGWRTNSRTPFPDQFHWNRDPNGQTHLSHLESRHGSHQNTSLQLLQFKLNKMKEDTSFSTTKKYCLLHPCCIQIMWLSGSLHHLKYCNTLQPISKTQIPASTPWILPTSSIQIKMGCADFFYSCECMVNLCVGWKHVLPHRICTRLVLTLYTRYFVDIDLRSDTSRIQSGASQPQLG